MPVTITKSAREVPAEIIFYVRDAEEGGFVAHDASESIFTEADSEEELEHMIRDAVRCHFDEDDAPGSIRTLYVRERTFAT
jgi:hypothetical protein